MFIYVEGGQFRRFDKIIFGIKKSVFFHKIIHGSIYLGMLIFYLTQQLFVFEHKFSLKNQDLIQKFSASYEVIFRSKRHLD